MTGALEAPVFEVRIRERESIVLLTDEIHFLFYTTVHNFLLTLKI